MTMPRPEISELFEKASRIRDALNAAGLDPNDVVVKFNPPNDMKASQCPRSCYGMDVFSIGAEDDRFSYSPDAVQKCIDIAADKKAKAEPLSHEGRAWHKIGELLKKMQDDRIRDMALPVNSDLSPVQIEDDNLPKFFVELRHALELMRSTADHIAKACQARTVKRNRADEISAIATTMLNWLDGSIMSGTEDAHDWDPVAVLGEADSLVNGDRQGDYGHPVDNYRHIAAVASELIKHKITPEQMAKIMVIVKLCRSEFKYKRDNYTDAAGYIKIANMCGIADNETDERR